MSEKPRVCTVCSEEKPLSQFPKNGRGATGRAYYRHQCKSCVSLAQSVTQRRYRNNMAQWFAELKNTMSCSVCGEGHIATLDFHHNNPREKEIGVGMAVAKGWGKERIFREIDKCTVLCSNCHKKLHYEERQ